MRYLSQRDPQWAARRLGNSQMTLGRWGCTVTSISMLSDYFGEYKSPADLAAYKNLYTSGGLILWKELNGIFTKFAWDGRRYRYYNREEIIKSVNDPQKACLIEVNHGTHWVVAMRGMPYSNDVLVVDPWLGRVSGALGDFHNISGSSHFVAK